MNPISTCEYGQPVSKVRIHPRGNGFLTLSAANDEICYWTLDSKGKAEIAWRQNTHDVPELRLLDATIDALSNTVLCVGRQRGIEVRYLSDGTVAKTMTSFKTIGDYSGYSAVSLNHNGRFCLASQIESQQTEIWELSTGNLVKSFWNEAITAFCLHPEGSVIAAVKNGLRGTSIRFIEFDGVDNIRGFDLELQCDYLVQGFRFNSRGDYFAIVGGIPPLVVQVHRFPNLEHCLSYQENQDLDVYTVSRPLFHRLTLDEGDVYDESPLVESAVFSSNGKRLISPDSKGQILEFDVSTGQMVNTLDEHQAIVTSLDINYRRNIVVSTDLSGTIVVWKRRERSEAVADQMSRPFTHAFSAECRSLDLNVRKPGMYRSIKIRG